MFAGWCFPPTGNTTAGGKERQRHGPAEHVVLVAQHGSMAVFVSGNRHNDMCCWWYLSGLLCAPSYVQRLSAVVANYGKLLIASRNLDFFTSFYRFLIQLLPAAVVAPLFFAGQARGSGSSCNSCLPGLLKCLASVQ